jgi:hypothetical protein
MAPKKIKSPNDSGKAMAEKSLPAKYTAKDRMYIIKQAKARNSEAGEGRNSKSNGEIDVGVWMKSAAAAFLRCSQQYS